MDELVSFEQTRGNWGIEAKRLKSKIQRLRKVLGYCVKSLSSEAELSDSVSNEIIELKNYYRKELRDLQYLLKARQMEEGATTTHENSEVFDNSTQQLAEEVDNDVGTSEVNLKRNSGMLDIAIERGLLFIHRILTTGNNLVAAIGSEAYREFMVLTPMLKLHIQDLSSYTSRLCKLNLDDKC